MWQWHECLSWSFFIAIVLIRLGSQGGVPQTPFSSPWSGVMYLEGPCA
jgi:hypothetical protein